MRLLVWFVFGLGLALLEGWARANFVVFPDPRVLVGVFLLLRTDRLGMASRVLGLGLAASAFDADPIGLWPAALALAAAILFPIRRNVRADHPLTVLISAAIVVTCGLAVRSLAVLWGSAPPVDGSLSRWTSIVITVGVSPVFCAIVVGASRWLPLVPAIAPNPSDQLFVRDNSFGQRVRR